jgi:hypothetical protein
LGRRFKSCWARQYLPFRSEIVSFSASSVRVRFRLGGVEIALRQKAPRAYPVNFRVADRVAGDPSTTRSY